MAGKKTGDKSARRTRPSAPKGGAKRKQAQTSGALAAEKLVAELRSQGFNRAKIGGFDIDGVLRGKYVSLDKLKSALDGGFGFCDVIFGWDVADVLYEQSKVTGWHTGYPDAVGVIDPSTQRVIPWEPGVVSFLAEFRTAEGEDHPACPRSLLRHVLAHGTSLGYGVKAAAEFEFFFFQETRDTLYQKNFHRLKPLDPGMFGYSWLRTGQDSELMRDLFETLAASDVEVEGLHTETGPGVYEAAIAADDCLRAADKAALFKTIVKQIAHRHGVTVTFMAKWSLDYPGCGGHLHQSLWRNGRNAFHDPSSPSGVSKVLRHYIGGQMKLMRELTAMMSPTINSYKRYVPGLWAPLSPSWGFENRTCALRVIGPKSEKAARVEHRQGAADINPYIALAASVGAGLYGVEQGVEPPPATVGDVGENEATSFPRNLEKAAELLGKSKIAKEIFGAGFVDHYVMTRRWEVESYRRAVTDWELNRYFETI